MGVVVSLIILAVGVFAFFVTIDSIPTTAPAAMTNTDATNQTWLAIQNASKTGDSGFNIIGVVYAKTVSIGGD